MLKKIVLILSVIMTGVGLFMWIIGREAIKTLDNDLLLLDIFDNTSFAPGQIGVLKLSPDEIMPVNDDLSVAWINEGEHTVLIPLIGYDINTDRFSATYGLDYQDKDGNDRVLVAVSECPEETREAVINCAHEYNIYIYELCAENSDNIDPEILESYRYLASDEGIAQIEEATSHYECEVMSQGNYLLLRSIGSILSVLGSAILVIVLLSYKFSTKKIIAGASIAVFILISVSLFSIRKKISTAASLKEYANGVYTLDYSADYKLDEILTSDLSTEKQCFSWVEDNLYYGLPISSEGHMFGCSAISVITPDGDHLMGRNYDFYETDCLIIHTAPEGGYESIGMVDTQYLNMGSGEEDTALDSAAGRIGSLCFPYITVDGINEMGVGISILMLDHDEIHQDRGKPDIIMTVAIRAILDTCANVDEAIELLDSYDMHSMLDTSFHLYITDRSGRAVIVEWIGNDMFVLDTPAVTNYYLSDPAYNANMPEYETDERYDILMEDISSCGGIATEEEAMGFMADAVSDGRIQTEWSCVYNLDRFEVTVCFDMGYNEPYVITSETFDVKR